MKKILLLCLVLLVQNFAFGMGKGKEKERVGIILMGKTGGGKSTSLNTIWNIAKGKEADEAKEYVVSCRGKRGTHECNVPRYQKYAEELREVGHSQTQKASAYTLDYGEDTELLIVDTPGLADTGGVTFDKEHVKKIIGEIQKHQFNAIVLVVNESTSRADADFKYYLAEIRKMLPKECADNIIVLVTYAQNGEPSQQMLELLNQRGFNAVWEDNCFGVDNGYLFAQDELHLQPNKKKGNNIPKMRASDKEGWEDNVCQIASMIECARNMKPFSSKKVKELSDLREELSSLLSDALESAREIKKEVKNLKRVKRELEEAKERISEDEDYMVEETYDEVVTRKPKNWSNGKNGEKVTYCTSCLKPCHNPCAIKGIYKEQGHPKIANCLCFTNNGHIKNPQLNCLKCGHPIGLHLHMTEYEEKVVKTRKVPRKGKKERHDNAVQDRKKAEDGIKFIERKIKTKEVEIKKTYRDIARLYKEIEETSLLPVNEFFGDYVEFQIRATEENAELSAKEKDEIVQSYKGVLEDFRLQEEIIQDALKSAQED